MKRAILLAILLSGCAAPGERQAARIASDDAQCQSYGIAPGTPPYVDCRMRLDRARAEKDMLSRGTGGLGLQGLVRDQISD